ncbi:cbb3-type cytochrome oxidase assembly protein CcoS [Parahaliea aestuarii]|uniref:Cbb3-type cytochrome oxidase assembly protein CcoS n=1 Tax=Parahaliea aestuarii TaxID=1852021 RepID=A0A5C8ZV53_9GAMM|nr:cbb3-type cytochrome oxidase assembly protein CcoS [Parahaliea aestuarii]TXS91460.1 cbb3-type cytochrome oxidase assembly protein CcoS [Parahaliea aestuarii]
MASLYLLIPVALIFCIVALRLLLWAINNGQYDDLDKEAWRVVMDDDVPGRKDEKPAPGDTPGSGAGSETGGRD